MPLYKYQVKNNAGKLLSGEVKIDSKETLYTLLVEKGFTPVNITEKNAFTDITQISIFRPKVKIKDLSLFCRQFAIVLEAGISIVSALDMLREQTRNRTLKETLQNIYENIQKGMSLSAAMKQHTKIFPEILRNMVEAGEVSGQLDRVFVRLADHFEKEQKLNNKVKSAMMYPAVVCVVSVLVIIIMLTFVLPKFSAVLMDLNVELPALTRFVIKISDIMQRYWWALFLLIVSIIIPIKRYLKTNKGKLLISTISINLPVLKGVINSIITARFARTLGTLVSSGVLMIQSLEVVQKTIGNSVICDKFEDVILELKMGKGLYKPIDNLKYFPPILTSMLKIGEESGNIDFVLNKTADFYDQEVENSVQRLTSMLEPVFIIILAFIVGGIVLSVLLPMMTIYENAGKPH